MEHKNEGVARDVAYADVIAWLDHKKVSVKRRTEKSESIESFISYVEDKTLVIDKENGYKVIQNLVHPIGKEAKIEKLVWEPFGQVGQFQIHMKNVPSTDIHGSFIAWACAQTKQSKTILNALDSEDTAVLNVLAGFFM